MVEHIESRYSAPATVEHFYQKEFAVECPKCGRNAVVIAGNPYFYSNAKLNCSNCGYAQKAADLISYKVTLRRYCDHCGKLISRVIPHAKEPVDAFAITCSACGEVRIYKPRNEVYHDFYNNPQNGVDPIFHLPLWLQGYVRENLFWAYNKQHLHDIKIYVGAKLRERQTTTHTTMVEKLPNFIKQAKNRPAILKLIERLERKGVA